MMYVFDMYGKLFKINKTFRTVCDFIIFLIVAYMNLFLVTITIVAFAFEQ